VIIFLSALRADGRKYLLIYALIVARMPLKNAHLWAATFEKTAIAVEGILYPDRFLQAVACADRIVRECREGHQLSVILTKNPL
jgi:hypothetical protein